MTRRTAAEHFAWAAYYRRRAELTLDPAFRRHSIDLMHAALSAVADAEACEDLADATTAAFDAALAGAKDRRRDEHAERARLRVTG